MIVNKNFLLKTLFTLCFGLPLSMFSQQNAADSLLIQSQNVKEGKEVLTKALAMPYDEMVNNLNRSLIIFQNLHNNAMQIHDPILLGDLKEKLATVYYLKGDHTRSSNLHVESIRLFEAGKDPRKKANAMAAMAYESKKRNLKGSISLMTEAITILRMIDAKPDLSTAVDNFGVLQELNGQLDTAMKYYFEALQIKEATKDSVGIPYSLNNIAGIHFLKKNYAEGLNFMDQSTSIRKRLKDYIGMSWNEYQLGEVYLSAKNNKLARQHFQKSLYYGEHASYPDIISRNFKNLSKINAAEKRFDSAYYYLNSFFTIYDSLYNYQNQKQLLEMETVYQTEKKSLQIKALNGDNELKEKEIEKKRASQKFLIFILVIAVAAGSVILRAYRQKNKANKIISLQKINADKQRVIIEEKQKEILDSIHYAERIQKALMDNRALIDKHLTESFVLFNPKDIVSGDFYWSTEYNNNFYLACCDSTGHGVPGAFMCLLNIGFLSEAIKEKNLKEPHQIFDYVRKRLIENISKEGQRDGMDGILIKLNKKENIFSYAAAYNHPIIIREQKILELKADKMPVGLGEKNFPFADHSVNLFNGDMLYLYSDGYADQFGGPKGKKFKYKQLNELLLSISDLSCAEQKEKLENAFIKWKGNLEQVDDVLIIGIKI